MSFRWNNDLIFLFHEGRYFQAYEAFGAHITSEGIRFCIWVPDTNFVAVTGDFTQWSEEGIPMALVSPGSEIWQIIVPEAKVGDRYKYVIETKAGRKIWKMDPYGREVEVPPATASIVSAFSLSSSSENSNLVKQKRAGNSNQPINIYEIHIGSWRKMCDSYHSLGKVLPAYLVQLGYTHVEFMPVMHHPFGGSWGYQITGFYAVNAEWGSPQELRELVEACHQVGLAVIFDWVPGHFCKNEEGLSQLNGQDVYEAEEHLEWGTKRFQVSRPEVRSFLLSNAAYWFAFYDIDGIRVDGVASMLQPDKAYDCQAVDFFKNLNRMIFRRFPYAIMSAEDSTAFPHVTAPVHHGGLGFTYKWNMGWMNDTLQYISMSPQEKSKNHHQLTFSLVYAFEESYILPFSHDEVVHGKKTLLDRMSGEYEEMFNQLRVLYLYMMTHPGKKLSFMGNELAPFLEWRYYEELEWKMLAYDSHRSFYLYLSQLNHFYLKEKSLWEQDSSWEGFRWVDADNQEQSIFVYQRLAKDPENYNMVVINEGAGNYMEYRMGVPERLKYRLVFTSATYAHGLDQPLKKTMQASSRPWQNQPYSICLRLPSYTGLILKPVRKRRKKDVSNG
ncbi:1,4-alpha-glucan branching protein GlgB [Gottschalkiaceae bacterium SANA]|nr:1,4-alpha-glucan branching protein GlgB [Gottschalkiaceae bacterium SANA]